MFHSVVNTRFRLSLWHLLDITSNSKVDENRERIADHEDCWWLRTALSMTTFNQNRIDCCCSSPSTFKRGQR